MHMGLPICLAPKAQDRVVHPRQQMTKLPRLSQPKPAWRSVSIWPFGSPHLEGVKSKRPWSGRSMRTACVMYWEMG